jgi:N-acetylneuraminic acid mutarotase
MTRRPILVCIQRLCLGIIALGGAIAMGSCTEDGHAPFESAPTGDQFLPRTDLRDGGYDLCANREQPGCPCETEGGHLVCGKVVEKLHDQIVCGKGVSVCTQGTWSECSLNNSDLSSVTVTEKSAGLSLQSLGAASPCAGNPCDPYCVTFPDSTQGGVQNPGTNISVGDQGLSTVTVPTNNCTPLTCAAQGKSCGPAGDGCGGVLNCGTCVAPQTCGGAGTPSVCGTAVPPGGACVPQTCAQLGASCGPAADGCGGLLNCGSCTPPASCGGTGVSGVCGTPPSPCVPKTCASLGQTCGVAGDSCGGSLNCGSCTSPQSCGGGGIPGACGPAACVPKTCAQLGANCGAVSDGCGGLLSCGSCNWPQTCGGAGTPSVCGTSPSCTNLCLQQTTCAAGATTKVTGTVYAPNGIDPLPNAVVYVPNGTVAAFTTSVSCDNCAQASGSPLVGTTSAVDGKFSLTNVPVGNNIPLVIQIGRWRRQVTIPTVNACTTTTVAPALTRLPKNKAEGDIPKQAFVTGEKDALECVLRKIGVDDTEFTNALGNGRVHLYAAAGPGSVRSTGATSAVNHGAVLGGVGPDVASAITPGGSTEWDYRLLDTHSWLMADAMGYSRAEHAAVLLPDGRVLVAGGFGASGGPISATTATLNTVEIYDPSTNTWAPKNMMSAQRAALTATLLPNGKVLVTGGVSGGTYSNTAELYTPASNAWGAAGTMTGTSSGRRARHTATLLGNGKVLVVGGTTDGTAASPSASLYDPATNTWSATIGAPVVGRFNHSATLLGNGKVLIAGGTNGTASVNTAELYNPATSTFTATPTNMPAPRQQHSDTLLPSGKVLLAGGIGATTASIATTAIYDPTANTWAAGPSMASARKGHDAVLLSDGTVVAFGGVDGTTYRTTEETYNPTTSTWSVVGVGNNDAHAFLTATTLQNGRVLMAGGYTTGGGLLGYSEVFINQPLNQYDITLFPCPGNAYYYSAAAQQRYQNNLASYANIGGRVFTTHFTWNWIYSDNTNYFSPLAPAVGWALNQAYPTPDPQPGIIDQSFPKGALLAQWLKLPAIAASTTLGQIPIDTLRHDFNTAPPPTQNWMTVNQPTATKMHLTFNTPLGAPSANQCGRVVFSDFHVEDRSSNVTKDKIYPAECDASLTMTPQEKLLEFMMFDLASCVTPDTIPACVPKTCGQLGLNCGQAGDGCGGTLSCGSCTSPQVCGWGSTPNVCTTPVACVPKTCSQLGLSCGPAGNGCGGTLNCGSCTLPEVCGAGGPGQCGLLTSQCVPTTCTALGLSCGPAGDGCGATLDCGSCSAPQTCGGGGQRGQCGSPPACVPKTCAQLGLSCGPAGDGCGGTLSCGSCTAPDTCGGGGQPGACGHGTEYTTGYFVRDYSSNCPSETVPVWSLWSWNSSTPSDSHIDFTVQTATTLAGLASAPSDTLLFSSPPGPASLVGSPASAHAANKPPGSPNTELGAADVDHTFVVNDRPRHNAYVRVTSKLVPTSNKAQTALLASWNLQMDCAPAQ